MLDYHFCHCICLMAEFVWVLTVLQSDCLGDNRTDNSSGRSTGGDCAGGAGAHAIQLSATCCLRLAFWLPAITYFSTQCSKWHKRETRWRAVLRATRRRDALHLAWVQHTVSTPATNPIFGKTAAACADSGGLPTSCASALRPATADVDRTSNVPRVPQRAAQRLREERLRVGRTGGSPWTDAVSRAISSRNVARLRHPIARTRRTDTTNGSATWSNGCCCH